MKIKMTNSEINELLISVLENFDFESASKDRRYIDMYVFHVVDRYSKSNPDKLDFDGCHNLIERFSHYIKNHFSSLRKEYS